MIGFLIKPSYMVRKNNITEGIVKDISFMEYEKDYIVSVLLTDGKILFTYYLCYGDLWRWISDDITLDKVIKFDTKTKAKQYVLKLFKVS
jgi:hypothetical protein